MINAMQETCHLLRELFPFLHILSIAMAVVSVKGFDNLGHISSLCRHFLASADDRRRLATMKR